MSPGCLAGCCPHPHHERPARQVVTAESGCPPDLPAASLPERVGHLYACQGLSTYRISEVVKLSRQRVTRMLRRSAVPVKPKGAGRPRAARIPSAFSAAFLADLYVQQRMTCTQISAVTGMPARTVRDRLVTSGVHMRTKGRGYREERLEVEPDMLAELYVRTGLPAAEVGALVGVSHRVVLRSAHDQGLPVRMGGPGPNHGPVEIELIEALYADAGVGRALERHGIAAVPPGGPIWQRFPLPARLTADLAADLYESCGLATTHIELLTGQPAASVGRLLRAAGVALRPAGGRSPFLRQWRAAGAPLAD
jgi:hypothetical protein